MPDAMLANVLWELSADLTEAALRHPHTRALARGSLAPEAFADHLAQQAHGLRALIGAGAVAAGRLSESPSRVALMHRLMDGLAVQCRRHARELSQRGFGLAHLPPAPAIRAYDDFLMATAWHGDAGQTLAAMVPRLRLPAWLGRQLFPRLGEAHPYRPWIGHWAGGTFHALVRDLEHLLGAVADDTIPVRVAYRYALEGAIAGLGAGSEQPPAEPTDGKMPGRARPRGLSLPALP